MSFIISLGIRGAGVASSTSATSKVAVHYQIFERRGCLTCLSPIAMGAEGSRQDAGILVNNNFPSILQKKKHSDKHQVLRSIANVKMPEICGFYWSTDGLILAAVRIISFSIMPNYETTLGWCRSSSIVLRYCSPPGRKFVGLVRVL